MEYAIVQTGGKQYKVSPGMTLDIENIKKDSGEIVFEDVLLYVDKDNIEIGRPTVSGFFVLAKIIGAKKGKKIRVSQFKAKSRHRRAIGYRQILTTVEIVSLGKKTASEKKKS